MDINEIIEIADKAYDKDGILSCQWDPKKRKVRKTPLNGMKDTLARFICVEIAETYDASNTDDEQREIASSAIHRASKQCRDVADALFG